jgi:putative transposase
MRHFDKQKAKTTKSISRKSCTLNQKRYRQRTHLLHSFTRSLVRDADARGVSTIIKMLTYKARLKGIRVVKEPEDYTSQTCCMCGTICKSNRVHHGLYVCGQCGVVINADVNGAINILKRYLPEQISVSWSSGCLAQPAVNRFAWRETRPSASAQKLRTWQTSLPHPRTGSAVALSEVRA